MAIKLEDIGKAGGIFEDIITKIDPTLFYIQNVYARTAGRIWGKAGAKDTEGKKLPKYNKKYAERTKKTAKTWDLQLSGNLINSYKVSESKGEAVMGFTSLSSESGKSTDEVAIDLELRAKTTIFSPSEKEIEQATKVTIREIINEFVGNLNQRIK